VYGPTYEIPKMSDGETLGALDTKKGPHVGIILTRQATQENVAKLVNTLIKCSWRARLLEGKKQFTMGR